MQKIDPRGWVLQLSSSLAVVGSAVVLALVLHHRWSWPLFVWGVALGPIASAYAYFSTTAFGRRLVRLNPAQREVIEARQKLLWARNRASYLGMVLFGVAVGIMSGGIHSPAPDIIFTVLWLLMGVLLPLTIVPRLLKRVSASDPTTGEQAGS